MKTCAELTQLLSEAQDRTLSFGEKFSTRTHLMWCRGCRNYQKQLNFLRDAMRSFNAERDKDFSHPTEVKKKPDEPS